MAPYPDSSPHIDNKDTKFIQSFVVTLLYCARSIGMNMFHSINEISQVQSKPKMDNLAKSRILLGYASIYPNDVLYYHFSKIILHINSDASKLFIPEARSFYAVHFYLSDGQQDKPH